MSGIHRRRRPAPIEDADLQTGEAIFTTAGDPHRGSSLLSSRRQPKVVSLSVSEAGRSGRRIMRNESHIEATVAAGPGCLVLGLERACVCPPLACGLAGIRDHRVYQHQLADGHPLADERAL